MEINWTQTKKLKEMNQERLRTKLNKALDDPEELGRGFLGQTGVHIGMRVLRSARHQFEQEEAWLKERIAFLEKLLHGGESDAGRES